MTQSLHPTVQKGFSSAAQLYQQSHPSYPQSLVNWVKALAKCVTTFGG